ncbi:MAG: prepilin-type N-terminal cleavage/methylation domain-containing protein [Planctomycetota bacterium]
MSRSTAPCRPGRVRRAAAFSLVELLVSLAIVAVLMVATMVAIDASFQAYASAAESASTQNTTRLVTQRVVTLVRTSSAHGPLTAGTPTDAPWNLMQTAYATAIAASHSGLTPAAATATQNGAVVEANFLRLIDTDGNELAIRYEPTAQELWLTIIKPGATTATAQPLLDGVQAATFTVRPREDDFGVAVLQRASIDITVAPDEDTTLAIESAGTPPIRVFASTMPRALD